ncbi:MAG: ribosomal L7Ae/L30e/S12e/Gadd45 family protein [Oscillospiraceae bacterium]|nr:ribosomal L7Ae/L30e/S12e/Gadd45 family protein [Oscillospiraceae bacterium]
MMESNYLSLLGLAKRAGMLEAGDEAVRAAISAGKVRLVLCASDASDRTRETFSFITESSGVAFVSVPETKEELGNSLGRRPSATVAVCDVGFAAAIAKKLAEKLPEAKECAERLSERVQKITKRKKAANKRKR